MSYVPEFVGEIEGWTVNFLAKNHWRVARTMPRDDCLQEAYCVFLKCRRRYTEVTEPAHFMALYKTAWTRKFADLSNEDTEVREHELQGAADDAVAISDSIRAGATDNDGMLAIMIRQAPREVGMVLSLFLNAPQELLDIVLAPWWSNERLATRAGSRRINRMLGLPEDRDTMAEVLEYFTPHQR